MGKNQNSTKWYRDACICFAGICFVGVCFAGIVSTLALLVGNKLIASIGYNLSLWSGLIGFSFVILSVYLLSIAYVEKGNVTFSAALSSCSINGAKIIIGLFIGVFTLGWFCIQSIIAGASISMIVAEMNGPEVPSWLFSICFGLIMVLSTLIGFKHLKWLIYVAFHTIILILILTLLNN